MFSSCISEIIIKKPTYAQELTTSTFKISIPINYM